MSDTATKTTGEQTTESVPMVTLTIDGREVSVKKGSTVLDACREHGIEVPTFCWHPKLRSVGACRICYVEIEKFPKLMVSCATEAMDGMVVFTDSEKVREGRKAVIEFILLDHPLDCPTCDKGGECDLQDNAFAYGLSDDSRYEFHKFRYIRDRNSTFDDLRIGPEMIRNQNRCILCYKCTRANEEIFGENDIGIYQRGNITEINAPPGGQVESLYSGNLVEICPVGALTASDWRYKIRVWNTTTVPSVCPYHADGANTLLWKDRKKVYRATSRRNDEVDEGWLSDITRYGYQIATAEDRLKTPLIKKGGQLVEASWEEAVSHIADRLKKIKEANGAPSLAGVISPNLDTGALHCFNKLMRGALGSNNIDYRSSYSALPGETGTTYSYLAGREFVISEIARSDALLVVGSDLIREHPNVHLWVRRAVTKLGARLYTANPYVTKSGDCSTDELIYNPGTDEVFLNGLTLSLIKQGLAKKDVDISKIDTLLIPNTLEECAKVCGVSAARIDECARRLAEAKSPNLIAGELVSTSPGRENIAKSLFNVAALLGIIDGDRGQCAILAKASNSKGAEVLGLYPELPDADKYRLAKVVDGLPEVDGVNWDGMLKGALSEEVRALIVFGSDPLMSSPDNAAVKRSLEALEFLVVADLFETPTTALADVVLPLSSFAEYDGSFINLEGRSQDFAAAIKPQNQSLPPAQALNRIAQGLGYNLYADETTLKSEINALLESYEPQKRKALLMESHYSANEAPPEGAVALFVGDALHHFGRWTEHCHSLKSFDPEPYIEISPETAERLSLSEGESVRVSSEQAKVTLKVKVSRLLEGETAFAPLNFSSVAVNSLVSREKRVNYVTLEKVG